MRSEWGELVGPNESGLGGNILGEPGKWAAVP